MGSICSPPASCCKRGQRLLEIRTFSQLIGMEPPLVLVLTCDKCDLHLQEHPMLGKLLTLDCFQSFVNGKYDLVRIGHVFLGSPSFCISFSIDWPDNIIFLLAFSHICGREVSPS